MGRIGNVHLWSVHRPGSMKWLALLCSACRAGTDTCYIIFYSFDIIQRIYIYIYMHIYVCYILYIQSCISYFVYCICYISYTVYI